MMKVVLLIFSIVILSCESSSMDDSLSRYETPDHESRLAENGSQEFDVLTQGGRIKGCKSKR